MILINYYKNVDSKNFEIFLKKMAQIYEQSSLMKEISKNAFIYIFDELQKLKQEALTQQEIQKQSSSPIDNKLEYNLLFS